jgi:diguanylate cyclase (GGDEF)-like protein
VLPALAAFLALIAVGGVTELIVGLLHQNEVERQRSDVLHQTATLRAKLEGEINSTLHLTRGLIAYVATQPEINQSDFAELAAEIVFSGRSIRNIGLARDNVITHLYPIAGNEAALGLDYRQSPSQWPAVKRAMDAKATIVAGPVTLAQGGTAFIARTPIFIRPDAHDAASPPVLEYWGMASIVIDTPALFRASGLTPRLGDTIFALRGTDGRGAEGGVIMGEATVFDADPVLSSITLPNGNWQLAATPAGGWGVALGVLWTPRITGWGIALVMAYLVAALLRTREINRSLALHDELTGLPNRRLLEDRLDRAIARASRHDARFGMFFLDLNGFKQVNDTYGHKAGDALLQEAAKRMNASVRASDTVARTGGDEFIILVDSIQQVADMSRIRAKLEQALSVPAFIDGHQLPVPASIGLAVYPDDGHTVDALFARADQRMYSEKHAGKVHRLRPIGHA